MFLDHCRFGFRFLRILCIVDFEDKMRWKNGTPTKKQVCVIGSRELSKDWMSRDSVTLPTTASGAPSEARRRPLERGIPKAKYFFNSKFENSVPERVIPPQLG